MSELSFLSFLLSECQVIKEYSVGWGGFNFVDLRYPHYSEPTRHRQLLIILLNKFNVFPFNGCE